VSEQDERECSRCHRVCIPLRGARCRNCIAELKQQYSLANRDRLRAVSKEWATKNRARTFKTRDAWVKANREHTLAYKKAYTAARRKKITAYLRDRRRARPEAEAARKALAAAVKKGTVKKTPCWVCGNPKVHGHHASYASDMRLLVVWLCPTHHGRAHSALVRPHDALDAD
jgi:hypothetical protein